MRHLNGTYDLTVDDIHEIRVKTSEKLEKMTNAEIIDFFNKQSKIFNDRMKKENSIFQSA